MRNRETCAILDRRVGAARKEYDWVAQDTLAFSPDSKHVAAVAHRSEKGLVVVDGVEGKEYDQIVLPTSEGNAMVFDSPDTLRLVAVKDGEILRVEMKIVEKQP